MRSTYFWPATLVLLVSNMPAADEESGGGPDFSAAGLSRRFEALRPDIEEALGEKLEGPIEVAPATREQVANVIAAENHAMQGEIEGGPRGDELRHLCEARAKSFSRIVLGKLRTRDDKLLVVEENFRTLASAGGEAYSGVQSPDFLDIILVHEGIHVFQNRKFGLSRLFGKPRSHEELLARMSVCEGHAQFITRKVSEKRQQTQSFDLLERVMSEVPSSVEDQGVRLLLEGVQQFTRFPYVEGRKLFTNVAKKLGYARALARVFEKPPDTLRAVSHPEEYLNPPKSRVELRKIALKGAGFLDSKKYKVQVLALPESAMRQACMLAGKEAVDRGLRAYTDSAVGVGAYQEGDTPGSQLNFSLIEFESEEAAKTFLELEEIVSRKKDEMFKEAGGLIQIISSEYAAKAKPDSGDLYVEKKLKISGLEGNRSIRSLVIGHRRFVVEVMAVYTPETREALEALAKKLTALLDEAPGVPARRDETKSGSRAEPEAGSKTEQKD